MKKGTRRVGLKKTTAPVLSTPPRKGESSAQRTPERPVSTQKKKKAATPKNVVGTPSSDVVPSPCGSKKWTPEREKLLCEMWEEEAHLYDATSKDYRNSNKRHRSLQRFSAALNIEG